VAYKNERQIEQDADAAAMGDSEAFVRIVNGMLNDLDWETRALCAFALLDRVPMWTTGQLVIVLEGLTITLGLNEPTGLLRRILFLTGIVFTAELTSRSDGRKPKAGRR